jgi:5-methylcytosine-specific restriction enzyme subunit McrC
MLRLSVLERGRLVRAESAGQIADYGTPSKRILPQRLFDRLARHEAIREDREDGAVFQWRRNYCLVGSWVGVLQVPGLQIEILPKTDGSFGDEEQQLTDVRSNLMEMLLRGGLGTVRTRGVADLTLKRGNLHDQLVDAFLDRAQFELLRGLDRGYETTEGNLTTLRGKLAFGRHLAVNAAQKNRFFCRHDVLTESTQVMVRLKQACRILATRVMSQSVLVKCQQLLAILDDVPDQPFRHRQANPLFTRQNERFADIYRFACMLLEGQAADAKSGPVETFSLLFDMEKVFERYIASVLATDVMPKFAGVHLYPQAKGHQLSLFNDKENADQVLRLKPDLLFVDQNTPTKRSLIVDTKWKRLPADKPARPERSDLYQLYAYLRRYNCTCAFFLYPKTSGVSSRDLSALAGLEHDQVGTISVRFIDLNLKLWKPEDRKKLADELAFLVQEGLPQDHLVTAELSA